MEHYYSFYVSPIKVTPKIHTLATYVTRSHMGAYVCWWWNDDEIQYKFFFVCEYLFVVYHKYVSHVWERWYISHNGSRLLIFRLTKHKFVFFCFLLKTNCVALPLIKSKSMREWIYSRHFNFKISKIEFFSVQQIFKMSPNEHFTLIPVEVRNNKQVDLIRYLCKIYILIFLYKTNNNGVAWHLTVKNLILC